MKKALKIFLILFCIIVLGVIAAVAIFLKSKLNKINYENISKEDLEISKETENRLKDYTNILLLGTDTRQEDTFDDGLSDCIMIFSINNKTYDVNIVSVYRDTFLQIDDVGLTKVNYAFAYKGAPYSVKTLNKNLDLDISQYVVINFESVEKIVDSVGGVTIDLTYKEAERITKFTGRYIGAGTQNLNGEEALIYGRTRKLDNDYVRTGRMRTVVMKVFEKIKNLSYSEISDLLDELLPAVSTNISQKKILSYMTKIKKYNIVDNFGWPYDVKEYISDQWYAAPVTLEENVTKLHQEIFNDKDYEPTDAVKEISNKIIEKTGYK